MELEKKKCFFCEKKIKVLGFDCKCGKYFCLKHRLPESHNCMYDHKTNERSLLKEKILFDNNFKKIQKI